MVEGSPELGGVRAGSRGPCRRLHPRPAVPQPNIYPIEWRVDTARLAELYEKSKQHLWNPADIAWDQLDQEDPIRKCFFSITRDEMNHEECCQRHHQAVAGRSARLKPGDRPGEGRAQQHRPALPQRWALLEGLQQLARQVSDGRAVHLVHDG